MQLLELSLYNFCLYRGEQTFNLSPGRVQGKPKPIVLVGGINGGGKTSLFDAILLVLYGKNANCSKRANQRYEDFLKDCIHRGVDVSDGASITLTFSYMSDGVERVYEVTRRWSVKKSLREQLDVYCDGRKHADFSKNWNHVVEEIVPIGISQLFFFDAEKIRFIADDESTSEALGSAIRSLLGLDLAERLIADMKVVQLKLAERQVPSEDQEMVDEWRAHWESLDKERKSLGQDCGQARNEAGVASKNLKEADEAFARVGGKHWEKQKDNENLRKQLASKQNQIEASLVGLASGSLPLALVADLLQIVSESDEQNRQLKNIRVTNKALDSHDSALLKSLRKRKVKREILAAVEQVQSEQREKRSAAAAPDIPIHLSENLHSLLNAFIFNGMQNVKDDAGMHFSELEQVRGELDLIRRELASTPREIEIKDAAEALKMAVRAEAEATSKVNQLEKLLDEKKRELVEVETRIEAKLLKVDAEQVASDDAERMSELCVRTRETMQVFLEKSTAAKIDQLAESILEAFRYLLRKKSLVNSIHIDPADFSITLLSEDGSRIPKQRLSEGEKQMFAISVLWGLGRSSNRRLPAIIDTPMGRLDAAHRQNLLERYFPSASHQTIILSTDTEVDEAYYESLEPHIARAYHLNYYEHNKQTVVEEGYFWQSDETKQD